MVKEMKYPGMNGCLELVVDNMLPIPLHAFHSPSPRMRKELVISYIHVFPIWNVLDEKPANFRIASNVHGFVALVQPASNGVA